MKLKFEKFGGMVPKFDEHRVPVGKSVECKNVRFREDVLTPIKPPAVGAAVTANTKALYPLDAAHTQFYTATEPMTFVPDFLGYKEKLDIICYATAPAPESYPKFVTGAGATHRLTIPKPVITGDTAVVDFGDTETDPFAVRRQSYVATIVDQLDRESQTSEPYSVPDDLGTGAVVNVSVRVDTFVRGDEIPFNKVRLYRTNTGGSGGTEFQFVKEVSIAGQTGVTIVDDLGPDELSEPPYTESDIPLPDDARGLTRCVGDFLVAYKGNELFVSRRNAPHAWPYSHLFEYNIVGVAIIESGILVCTTERPYIMTGTSPEALQRFVPESDAGCVSENSVVDMGGYAVYASGDGLALAQGNTVEVITESLFSRKWWHSTFDVGNLRGFLWQGFYVLNDPTNSKGLLVDPKSGDMTLLDFDLSIQSNVVSNERFSLTQFIAADAVHQFNNGET